MKNLFRAFTTLAFAIAAFSANATTSSVNPTVPAQNSPLSSAAIRNGISLPAYNDINQLFAQTTSGGITPIANNTVLGNISGATAVPIGLTPSQISTLLGLGTAAFVATGTSGATIPLLNGNLIFTGSHAISLNSGSLPTKQTGTIVQMVGADTVIGRNEIDVFGAAGHYSVVRADGTASSPTTLQAADAIGSFNVFGYNGTANVGPFGAFRCFANQNWSVGVNGTYCDVATTPNGSTTMATALKFEHDGGMTTNGVTGGDMGPGTINAAGLYINGALVSTSTGGGGSGIVGSGSAKQFAVYPSTGTTVGGSTLASITTAGISLAGLNAITLGNGGLDTTSIGVGPGAMALSATLTGNNVAMGAGALAANVSDAGNVAIGAGALQSFAIGSTTTLGANTAVGFQSLNVATGSSRNTAFGYQALKAVTTSTGANVAIGWGAGSGVTTGTANFFGGVNAGSVVTTGQENAFVLGAGVTAGTSQATCFGAATKCGQYDTAIGYSALNATNADTKRNTAVGKEAGKLTTGGTNVFIGETTGYAVTTGASNTYVGQGVVGSGGPGATGSNNSCFGQGACGVLISTGAQNSVVGSSALSGVTSGNGNVVMGYQAATTASSGTAITTGVNNTVIGFQAAVNSAAAINRTALGNAAISTADNDIVLGNASIATIHAQVTSITAISDRRHKKDIEPLDIGLDFIMKLKPVSYRLKTSDTIDRFGFIAQDAEKALPNKYQQIFGSRNPKNRIAILEVQDNAEGTYNMNYGELIAPLVQAIQEQQKEIDALKKQAHGRK